jgi:hypothetical protein
MCRPIVLCAAMGHGICLIDREMAPLAAIFEHEQIQPTAVGKTEE